MIKIKLGGSDIGGVAITKMVKIVKKALGRESLFKGKVISSLWIQVVFREKA
jgi:hypothetical protein